MTRLGIRAVWARVRSCARGVLAASALALGLAAAAPAAHAQGVPPDNWWQQYANEQGFQDALWRLGTSVAALNANPDAANQQSRNMLNELYWLWWTREIYQGKATDRHAYRLPVLTEVADVPTRTTAPARGNFYFSKVYGREGQTIQIETGVVPAGARCVAITFSGFDDSHRWDEGYTRLTSGGTTSYTFPRTGVLSLGCYAQQKWPGDSPIGTMVPIHVSGGEPASLYIFGVTPLSEWHGMATAHHETGFVYLFNGRTQFAMPQAQAQGFKNPDVHINTWLWSHLRTVLRYDRLDGYGSIQGRDAVEHGLWTASLAACCYASSSRGMMGLGWGGALNIWTSWGDWHEYGHEYQAFRAWVWEPSLTETTVNVYSTVACRLFKGDNPDLLTCHPNFKDRYWDPEAVQKFLASGTSHANFDGLDIWVKLSMFDKLLFTYGEDLYADIGRAARRDYNYDNGAALFNAEQKKKDWFALNASLYSGHDLRIYFARWGLHISDATQAQIAALNLPQP